MTYGTSMSRKSTRRVVRLDPVCPRESPRSPWRFSRSREAPDILPPLGVLVSLGRASRFLRLFLRANRADDIRDLHVPEVNSPRRAARPGMPARIAKKPLEVLPKSRSAGHSAAAGGAGLLGRTSGFLRLFLRANRADDLRDLHVPEVNSPRRAARPGMPARIAKKPLEVIPKSRSAGHSAAAGGACSWGGPPGF